MIVYTPFTDEDLESQRTEWPKWGDQEEARTRKPDPRLAQAAFPLHCGCLAFFVLASLALYPPALPLPSSHPRTPPTPSSPSPAAADQPGWLKSFRGHSHSQHGKEGWVQWIKLLAMAQVSFKEMINYGTPRPEAEHHNSAKIIAQKGKGWS